MMGKDEQTQENKNTNPPPPLNLQTHSFSSLPDEIVENILARVSKAKYPTLSLVSKRFRSLLSSPELYKTRSLLGTTEPCLYLCLKHSEDQPPRWYSLWMKPVDETLTEGDNPLPRGDYSLFPVPSSTNPTLVPYYSMVAVGSELYVIGGGSYKARSSAVRILDCRTHTWRDGPSMLVSRLHVYAFLLAEKIYVMGSCGIFDESLNWIEVLDIKTQTWRHLRSHGADEFDDWFEINVVEGKIHAIGAKRSNAYDPQESRWEVVEKYSCSISINAWCVIEDVMYCFTDSGDCKWYDSNARDWIDVKGSDLELLLCPRTCSPAWGRVEMHNVGGKLLVMWVPYFRDDNDERRLWCAKIALQKRGNEVWGKIEWANSISDSPWFFSCGVISI
ncbi:unnamed protein product [Eruca vesicaria subsp. sativa]|uniref:F-box domain-containing protein n=1 Tax=Eruca vesicaria subsp. sativa TaxID=29727 RepID=A0ABC8KN86_ERUVS|nr:unnamed protein product [Eruca vesicaria subsp. sativa]